MSKKVFLGFLVSILLISLMKNVNAESQVCIVYFTGIGCPHCAKADPFVLEKLPEEYEGRFVVVEYEIYQNRVNVPIFQEYDSIYKTGIGIPLVIFGKDDYVMGDTPIIDNLRGKIDEYLAKDGNPCPMIDGSSIPFDEINIEDLPGSPSIFSNQGKQNPITGEVVQQENFNWIMIGGVLVLIVIILVFFKMGVKVKTSD